MKKIDIGLAIILVPTCLIVFILKMRRYGLGVRFDLSAPAGQAELQ